jgi:hypothetical protein
MERVISPPIGAADRVEHDLAFAAILGDPNRQGHTSS